MTTTFFKSAAFAIAMILPGAALASNGIATGDVNMRTGPSTGYSRIQTIPGGAGVTIFGCLGNRSWCDVSFAGARGWVSANYLARLEHRRALPSPYVGVPTLSFSFGNYHDRYYKGRPWYRNPNWRDDRWRRDNRHRWNRDDNRRGAWRRDDSQYLQQPEWRRRFGTTAGDGR